MHQSSLVDISRTFAVLSDLSYFRQNQEQNALNVKINDWDEPRSGDSQFAGLI
jgi:hypothetical protein